MLLLAYLVVFGLHLGVRAFYGTPPMLPFCPWTSGSERYLAWSLILYSMYCCWCHDRRSQGSLKRIVVLREWHRPYYCIIDCILCSMGHRQFPD